MKTLDDHVTEILSSQINIMEGLISLGVENFEIKFELKGKIYVFLLSPEEEIVIMPVQP